MRPTSIRESLILSKKRDSILSKVVDLPRHRHVRLEVTRFRKKGEIDKSLEPIALLHGLFGDASNYKAAARDLIKLTNREVYGIDLRNHGQSPHAAPHTYNTLTQDVIELVKHKGWKQPILVGHSMGAKVAMLAGLYEPGLWSKLVVVDNSPVKKALGQSFENDLLGLCEVELQDPYIWYKRIGKFKWQYEAAYNTMRQFESSHAVRTFLLGNLKHLSGTTDENKIRMPVLNLLKENAIAEMGEWPAEAGGKQFTGPVKVMKAMDSDFIAPEDMEAFRQHFPNIDYEEFNTTHWLVSDDRKAFARSVAQFVNNPVHSPSI